MADGWSGYIATSANYFVQGTPGSDFYHTISYQTVYHFDPVVAEDTGDGVSFRKWRQGASFEGEYREFFHYDCGSTSRTEAQGTGEMNTDLLISNDGTFELPAMTFGASPSGPPHASSASMDGSTVTTDCFGGDPQVADNDQPPCFFSFTSIAPQGLDTVTVQGTRSGHDPAAPWIMCVDGDGASGFLGFYLTRDPDPPECGDGIDNDGDDLIDYAGGAEFEGIRDPGCQSPTDDSEDSPPAKCNDGLDNDGDTLVDWAEDGSDDPGCSEADDDSELGTNACDNGTDDDGDGKTDWPADPDCAGATGTNEAENCLTSALGQRRRADLYFKGKVAAAGLPDAHLFDFKPFLTYCFGGGAPPEVISAATFGNIDYGADTAALELLGFTPEYNNESVTKTGNRATLTGNFDVRFDWLSILVRVGAAKAVKKVFDKKFTKAVDKLLKGDKEKAAQKKVLGALGKLEGKILAAYWRWSKAAYDASPAVLQGSMALLANWLYQRFEGKLAGYYDEAAAWVSSKALAKLTAKRLSAKLSGRLFAAFSGGSAFQVWTPVVNVEVLPSGELSVLDTGTANFLLTIDYSEQVTDIPVP